MAGRKIERTAASRQRLALRDFQKQRIAASFDAAQTTTRNTVHWAAADSLSPDSAATRGRRQTIRNRARYEVANNCYARGILLTLANHTIGTGPRLQLLGPYAEANRKTERLFREWAAATRLAQKLRTARIARGQDGEVLGLLTTNEELKSPVKLDLTLAECDRLHDPDQLFDEPNNIDGVFLDDAGNPIRYRVLDQHPGNSLVTLFDKYTDWKADQVLHFFREDRPEQHRGLSEIMPALELFAILRRLTLATVQAAEIAADFAIVIQSQGQAFDPDSESFATMDTVELTRGMGTVMPEGWEAKQIAAEHPNDRYGEFKRELINEIARCLNIPYNVAACNSADYNYASGRLDHQTYFTSIRVDRSETDLHLDKLLDAWIEEAVRVESFLPQEMRMANTDWTHQWFWDGQEHVDPVKNAMAQKIRLQNRTTTLAQEYAKDGLDWELQLEQSAKEEKKAESLGIDPSPQTSA
jgi:capsid protein